MLRVTLYHHFYAAAAQMANRCWLWLEVHQTAFFLPKILTAEMKERNNKKLQNETIKMIRVMSGYWSKRFFLFPEQKDNCWEKMNVYHIMKGKCKPTADSGHTLECVTWNLKDMREEWSSFGLSNGEGSQKGGVLHTLSQIASRLCTLPCPCSATGYSHVLPF